MNSNFIQIDISRQKMIRTLVSSIIIFLFAILIWLQQDLEYKLLIEHNFVYQNPNIYQFFRFFTKYGMSIIMLLYSLTVFKSVNHDELASNRSMFFLIIICFATGGIFGDLLKEIIDRSRPVIELGDKILNTDISETSAFPSGHSTKSMALALPFVLMASNKSLFNKIIKALVLFIGLMVCYSRIALQKHYLSDVLGGIAIAMFFVIISIWIVNFAYKRMKLDSDKQMMMNKRLRLLFIGFAIILSMM